MRAYKRGTYAHTCVRGAKGNTFSRLPSLVLSGAGSARLSTIPIIPITHAICPPNQGTNPSGQVLGFRVESKAVIGGLGRGPGAKCGIRVRLMDRVHCAHLSRPHDPFQTPRGLSCPSRSSAGAGTFALASVPACLDSAGTSRIDPQKCNESDSSTHTP